MAISRYRILGCTIAVLSAAACSSGNPIGTGGGGTTGPISFAKNPCSPTATVQLDPAETVQLDCSQGGTTVTLAGNGASYMVVGQFATDQVVDLPVQYTMITGSVTAASLSAQHAASQRAARSAVATSLLGARPAWLPGAAQASFAHGLLAQARAARPRPMANLQPGANLRTPPTLGSTQSFHVIASSSGTFQTVTAQLVYVGQNLLLYVDVNAPANGFTPDQLTAFGLLFDQTFYPLDVNAFGPPSDIDGNGHIIMLMSPVVNGISPASQCATNGYIAGFFAPDDFSSVAVDPNSNQGEIFYSVVPDPSGLFSCTHTVADVGQGVPATFMHELQHLIDYSQHVVVNQGAPESSWLDEGLSIVAEELGSLYYEQKCPAPACRTDPSQIFPDSAEGFAQGFLYDSYQYALLPDSASTTLHTDSDPGFAWRGGDWLLMRYLGDQYGSNIFKTLEQGPADGVENIAASSGQPFPTLFGNFGLALYADSFPALARATAPAVNRFASRNLRQLWNRLFVTSDGDPTVPASMPLVLSPISDSVTTFIMDPGTSSYWRLDTAASDTTVTIRFAPPSGTPFSPVLQPRIAIMRLPPGQ